MQKNWIQSFLSLRYLTEGKLWFLGCESYLGSRPVALRLWVDSSESQVDAWASVMVLFSHLMLPIVLRGTFHQQKCPVTQRNPNPFHVSVVTILLRWRLLAKAEHSGVTQTDGGNDGLRTQGGFIVTVPSDAVMAIAIQVTQQGVEAAAARLLHCQAKGEQ